MLARGPKCHPNDGPLTAGKATLSSSVSQKCHMKERGPLALQEVAHLLHSHESVFYASQLGTKGTEATWLPICFQGGWCSLDCCSGISYVFPAVSLGSLLFRQAVLGILSYIIWVWQLAVFQDMAAT